MNENKTQNIDKMPEQGNQVDVFVRHWFYYGVEAKKKIHKFDKRFSDWDIFSKSFGFFQFKKKHNMTDEQIEAFKQGFIS